MNEEQLNEWERTIRADDVLSFDARSTILELINEIRKLRARIHELNRDKQLLTDKLVRAQEEHESPF